MADITYATDGKESNFVAESPAGEEFLGGPELTVPDYEADAYPAPQARQPGRSVGLRSRAIVLSSQNLDSRLNAQGRPHIRFAFRRYLDRVGILHISGQSTPISTSMARPI